MKLESTDTIGLAPEYYERFIQERSSFLAMQDELRRRYPNEYVGILNAQVVDHDRDRWRLTQRVRLRAGSRFALIASVDDDLTDLSVSVVISVSSVLLLREFFEDRANSSDPREPRRNEEREGREEKV